METDLFVLPLVSRGEWPRVDWIQDEWEPENIAERELAGQPLADGMCALILCLKGDLDHVAKSWKLRHYNADEMCDFCPANRQETSRHLLYNIVTPDAKWPERQYTATEWR